MSVGSTSEAVEAAALNESLTRYHWEPQPQAERWLHELVDEFLRRLPAAKAFAERLYVESGNRLVDLIDTIWLTPSDPRLASAPKAGWADAGTSGGYRVLRNAHGIFPPIAVCDGSVGDGICIDLKVESVADFVSTHELQVEISSSHYAPSRWAPVHEVKGRAQLGVRERHGYNGFEDAPAGPALADVYATLEAFQTRRRDFPTDDEGFDHGEALIDAAIARVGRDVACDLWFRAEREYWQRKNRAAQYQHARQQKLGIGWANHDHHTYRNSRRNFYRLVRLWEKLGFECRERFSPGIEAGWGAQVMEQPVCGIVTFNDVDISPAELLGDFAHRPLEEWTKLHTVGLWCALHGDSFLQAGMHHLECTFDFDALRDQIQTEAGIKVMKPFTDYPYLRQAFTEGERWKCRPERIERTLKAGLITKEQADQFVRDGAIGSHLENLERNQGFKGFNQQGVTEIIAATDPRKQAALAR
jgi:hypothetical protein